MNRRITLRRPRKLWPTLLFGPLLGTTYFFIVYLAAEAACARGIKGFDERLLRLVIAAATLGVLIAIAVGALHAGRLLARSQSEPTSDDAEGNLPGEFVGYTGLILAGLFLLFALLVVGPVLGSSLC